MDTEQGRAAGREGWAAGMGVEGGLYRLPLWERSRHHQPTPRHARIDCDHKTRRSTPATASVVCLGGEAPQYHGHRRVRWSLFAVPNGLSLEENNIDFPSMHFPMLWNPVSFVQILSIIFVKKTLFRVNNIPSLARVMSFSCGCHQIYLDSGS